MRDSCTDWIFLLKIKLCIKHWYVFFFFFFTDILYLLKLGLCSFYSFQVSVNFGPISIDSGQFLDVQSGKVSMCQQPSRIVVQFPPEEAFFLGRKFMLMIFKLLELLRQFSSWPTPIHWFKKKCKFWNFGRRRHDLVNFKRQHRQRFQHPHSNTVTGLLLDEIQHFICNTWSSVSFLKITFPLCSHCEKL